MTESLQTGLDRRSAGFLMGVTSRKMSQLFTQRLKPFDITPEQWSVLYCVRERGGMIQTEIARQACKDKPTTTRILDALEAKGWITKRPGRTDRRSFVVHASESGAELIARTESVERQCLEDATSGIGREEYNQLIRLLRRIGDNIDSLTDNE